jgi:hypothetical protein
MSHPVMNQTKSGTDHVFSPPWQVAKRLSVNKTVSGPDDKLRKETWSVPDFAVAQVSQ